MTSIVLAGGRSSRLGWNKALQLIEGRSLIQWVVDCLAVFSTELIIASADGETIPCASPVPMRAVADARRGKGPLAGIYSGLAAATSSKAIVVACDMPFLNAELLCYMYRISTGFDVVMPATDKGIEPLCAVYSRQCLAPIRSLLDRDRLGVRELLDMVRVRYVYEDELDSYDPERLSLFNINSLADLDRARGLVDENRWLLSGYSADSPSLPVASAPWLARSRDAV